MSRSKNVTRLVVAAAVCLAGAVGASVWLAAGPAPAPAPELASPPTPTPVDSVASSALEVITSQFEDAGLGLASRFTGPIRNPMSLAELKEAIESRKRLGLSVMRAEAAQAKVGDDASPVELADAAQSFRGLGLIEFYAGNFNEASAAFEKSRQLARESGAPPDVLNDLVALRGIVELRRGEVDNCIMCVGPSSCIFPIAPEAAHARPEGARAAAGLFSEYLKERPGDLRVRWLLNIAHMALDEYPAKVPAAQIVPLDAFQSAMQVPRFENVATAAGLSVRGPNQAGGSVFDDFNGDGLPDLFTTSLDVDRGASLFINKGDGSFEDRSSWAGLDDQVYALNLARADYDNDGDNDVVLLRGGWEGPMRLSLLRNNGDGSFEDVTEAAGMAVPISTESASWGDFDNDGFVDLFVSGETVSPGGGPAESRPDPRNLSRLYKNKGDGTFVDVAATAGVTNESCSKGSAWGDYDGDGRLDLFVSNLIGACRLYHNEGDGTFRDVADELGVTGASRSFACWFWDFDNDGKLDIFVNDYTVSLAETVADALAVPSGRTSRPRLYRNLGAEGFREVSREVGLDRGIVPMGCNFGDFDNDGYLDIYFGTGVMSYEYLVPNLLYKNVGGKLFVDVTLSSGTGHLQKGHGISFADYDNDFDLDFFAEAGGGVPGDRAYNLLFQNPGKAGAAVKVRLVGTKTNRSALGASIATVVRGEDGSTRTVHRTVGTNASFGGNSLVETIGLGDAKEVEELTVTWPSGSPAQTFKNVPAGRFIEITEGAPEARALNASR